MTTGKVKIKKGKPRIDKPLIKSPNLFPVVGIGASAGGLDAFKKLLKAIPEESGMAYVLVQHLDPSHESMLQELLQKVTKIPVLEIADDIKVEPNHIYVIPSNKMMVATDGVLLLAPRPAKNKNERNLPIDLFFTSLAEIHQSHAIGVVLSGTASDGTLGLKAIKDHGGITFAQDEASAAYQGMPHSAVQAGVVDFILPPEKIPQKLLEVTKIITGNGHTEENIPLQDEEVFKQILSLLHIRKGTDFTYYKQTTIRRRILRRMAINKNEEPAAYLKYLRENKPEQDMLYQDLLIPVTAFFRDPKTFDNLCETVFPLIVKNKQPGEPIRIWVAGCSTGEEAYSIAICLKEFLGYGESVSIEKVQIFATDISEPAIIKARAGIFTKTEAESLSPQRLQEFFTKTNGSYQVNKSIRDMCVFAVHNFLKDPPFGKMDLISCRNVLIYMETYLQKKALTTFHYALNLKGFLLLGKSETTGGVPELFVLSPLKKGKSEKLFTRKDVPGKFMHVASQRSEQHFSQSNTSPVKESVRTDFQKTADDIMLRKYTPAGVVINEAMDIVHFRGNTGNYLQQSPGKPSHNLLKMAKEGLAFELRNILHKVKKQKTPVIKENIPVEINGVLQQVTIEALLLPDTIEPHYLVLFHEDVRRERSGVSVETLKKKGARLTTHDSQLTVRIAQLEKELAQSREDMRGITEDQEASNEELQSSNEELLSSSEELQSLNEELETGKEELQSTNEELTIVNQEMISLNVQVTTARDYSEAIIANMHEPFLVLDKQLRIKTGNNAFYKTFRVTEKETEGILIYDLGNKQWDIPGLRRLLEKILPEKSVFNDFEVTQTFSNIGERVMLLNAREVLNKNSSDKLILLSIEDITERKLFQDIEKKLLTRFQQLVMEAPVSICIIRKKDYLVEFANESYLALVEKGKDFINKPLFESLPELIPAGIKKIIDSVLETGIPVIITEMEVSLQRVQKENTGYFNFGYQPMRDADGNISGIIAIGYEVTTQVVATKKIKDSEKQFHFIADSLPQKIWTADAAGNRNYFNQQWTLYSGLSLNELKNSGWENLIHPDDRGKTQKSWQESINNEKDFEIENRIKDADGNYLWHLTRGIAYKDENGKINSWIGTNTEIETLKKEEFRKGNFIKMVSHELKTPITSIKGYVQLLLMMMEDAQVTQDPAQVKNSLSRIDNQVVKLIRLITEMLDLSRIESDRLELQLESFSINDLVKETIQDIRQTNPKNKIEFQEDFRCMVTGDKNRIEQVIINVISNAIKYSNDNTPIEVRIAAAKENQVAISVKDYGIGINTLEHKKIFERFYRVHGKNEQTFPGFGIGLFIANEIIERHHGFITIESEQNKGSLFTFTLPLLFENKT